MATEFLPICDNLFNVISLAAYFCDCVFDMVLGYALFERGKYNFFFVVVIIIAGSLIVSQIVSLKWYLRGRKLNKTSAIVHQDSTGVDVSASSSKISKYSVIGLHCAQLGILCRYAKLFVPVDLRFVKHEVRDLCILRLIHAFCEAAPMLLIQSYILITLQTSEESKLNPIKIKTLGGQLSTHLVQQSTIVHQYQQKTFKDLNTISAFLSLFSVCWALASFSKNVRVHNVHRLVLTWLGVIFQFFWRLGTVTSRVLSLTVYASVYKQWIFLVIVLHWISMFLWLISPKNAFHGERISKIKKLLLSALVAFIYVFAYINLQEVNHKQKMTIFYVVMFLENSLLVSLWMVGIWPERSENWYTIPLFVLTSFILGIVVMVLYYKYFHIRRLGYEADTNVNSKNNKCSPYSNVCRCNGTDSKYTHVYPADTITYHQKKERGIYKETCDGESEYTHDDKVRHNIPTNAHLKGIFNCRFSNPVNNATKRKKKKPTSFIPPPTLNLPCNMNNGMEINGCINQENSPVVQAQLSNKVSGPMSIPFWRQPLPRNSLAGGSSENEGSVASSRINIQLKLQEKKQKQLAELKIIEEEIKQGKLGRPNKLIGIDSCDNEDDKLLPRQPAPRAKKHIDIETIDFSRESSGSEAENLNILLHQLQQNNENANMLYNNFSSSSSGIAAALTKFSHEILSNINIGEKPSNPNVKQPSGSSTMTSTTSENENNSLTRQMMSSRKNFMHHNMNIQSRASPRISSPSCHFDPRPSAYNSLEGKNKTDTNRSSNSKNENSGNNNASTSSMEKDKSLASQLIKRQMQRGNTPEILLAPNHLEGNSHTHFYLNSPVPNVPVRSPICDGGNVFMNEYRHNAEYSNANGYEIHEEECDDENSPNAPSDIDSQMSLPRSYTLPREFKFNRAGRKINKNEHFIPSTNSSDGDVDSCDDNEFEDDDDDDDDEEDSPKMSLNQRMRNRRTNNLNKSNFMNKSRNHTNSPFSNISPNIMAQKQYQNVCNLRGHPSGMKVNNLDLLNGCIENGYQNGVSSRATRSRIYGQNAFNRHETKL